MEFERVQVMLFVHASDGQVFFDDFGRDFEKIF